MKIEISPGGRIALSSTQAVPEALTRAMEELLPLLQARIDAEVAEAALSPQTDPNRFSALNALDMSARHHLERARSLWSAMTQLAAGEASAAEFGFPEFEDGVDPALYD